MALKSLNDIMMLYISETARNNIKELGDIAMNHEKKYFSVCWCLFMTSSILNYTLESDVELEAATIRAGGSLRTVRQFFLDAYLKSYFFYLSHLPLFSS